LTPNERVHSFRLSTALAASFVLVLAAGAAPARASVKFVVIVLGQSNALGRAPKPVYGDANGFAYRRTRIWATDIHEPAGVNSGPPLTAASTRGWQPFDPAGSIR